jgi:uncharacterized iron-regulated membrane protein
MSFLNQTRSKRLLAIHGWSGIVLGVLLYTVVLTGAVAVFAHEIGVWSVGGTVNKKGITQPIDATIKKLAANVEPEYREDVGIFPVEDGSLSVFFHKHETKDDGNIGEKGVRFIVDGADGRVMSRAEGWSEDVFGSEQKSALRKFLVDLHVQLYVPSPYGLLLTGILGLAMMVAAISGVLLHKHIIKDIFVSPRVGGRLLEARDRHILAGTWGLPFAFLLAFTGSFLSFATSVGLPIVAMSAFGGDQMKVLEIIGGAAAVEDTTPAEVANLDAIVVHGARRATAAPTFLQVEHYGRADAKIGLFFTAPDGDLSFLHYGYSGVTGKFEGTKPGLGTVPSAGASAYTILAALHYGTFGGLSSKIVWVSLGLACCYVIISGMRLWLRRRAEDPGWKRAAKLVPLLGLGLPLAMLIAAHVYFQTIARADTTYWTPAGFFAASLTLITAAVLHQSEDLFRRRLTLATATAAAALPAMRLLAGGRTWSQALAIEEPLVVTFDLLLLITAGCLLVPLYAGHIGTALWWLATQPRRRNAEPAE